MFEEELFKAIKPAAIEASLKAAEAFNQRYQDKLNALERERESAQYEANRAFMQYNQVDPLNRLVASELERRWNEKLEALNNVKERIELARGKVRKPGPEEIEELCSLSERLPEIWRHPDTEPTIQEKDYPNHGAGGAYPS